MADIEIIRESVNGFTHQGHSVIYADSYIKVRRSFRQHALRLLRGAPLSCFWEIALADEPPDVQTICANTGYTSTATVCAALDFLVERHFIQEIRRDGPNGVKRYRAINYAWSGSDRQAPQDIVGEPTRISNNEIRQSEPQTKIRPAKTKIPLPKSEIRRDVHDDDDLLKHKHQEKTSSIHVRTEIEKIFATVFDGINVRRLAARVDSTELAQAWADWIQDPATRKSYRNPQGFSYTALMAQENARPPFVYPKEEHLFRPGGISGKLAATILEKCAPSLIEDES